MMLEKYIAAAMSCAVCEHDSEDGRIYCEIPGLPGVWSYGDTEAESRQQLEEVLIDWVELGLKRGHRIPVVGGIDVNALPA